MLLTVTHKIGEPARKIFPRTTAERIPNRARRIAALGNGVVLQQVYPLLAAMRLVIEGVDGMEVIS